MSLSPATLDAMLAAGCTAEQIVTIVKAELFAEQQVEEARKATARESNAERQQRFRDRRKEAKSGRNKSNALRAVTPPIDNTHTPIPDISPDGESQSERDQPAASDECDAVAELWNAIAKPLDLSVCNKMTGKRRKACMARIRSDGFEAIRMAIEHVPKSRFLRGDAGNWGGASIDFILRPDSVTAILEGKYDDRTKNICASSGPQPDRRSSLARAIDDGLEWLGSGSQAGIS